MKKVYFELFAVFLLMGCAAENVDVGMSQANEDYYEQPVYLHTGYTTGNTDVGIPRANEKYYELQVEKDLSIVPNIILNETDNEFTLGNDVLTPRHCTKGTYRAEGEILTVSIPNGEQYLFKIVGDDTLQYIQEESKPIALGVGDGWVEDGAKFLLVDYGTETGNFQTTKNYVLQTEKDAVLLPNIRLNEEDNTFTLENDVLSSFMYDSGTYHIENDILTAYIDGGRGQYVFEVIGNDTLRYVKKESNVIGYVEDGDDFILMTE